jgi:hypothetical protein
VNGRSQNDPMLRMVKEKLGLQMPLSQDPSLVAETKTMGSKLKFAIFGGLELALMAK